MELEVLHLFPLPAFSPPTSTKVNVLWLGFFCRLESIPWVRFLIRINQSYKGQVESERDLSKMGDVAKKRKIKEEDEEEEEVNSKTKMTVVKMEDKSALSTNCPFLDTINRNVLDFDFEKLCSVSLSRINVYACLVCGKYFQGRGHNTHAYTHSVSEGHRVYLNLETK